MGDGPEAEVGATDRRSISWRRLGSTALAVVAAFALLATIVVAWVDDAVFDGGEFARRTTTMLESTTVRHALAEEITDQLIESTPVLVAFRSLLVTAVEDVIATDGFRRVFESAVRTAHRIVFTESGERFIVDLSKSLEVISSTLEIINPDLAKHLPPDTSSIPVDVSEQLRRLGLWQLKPVLPRDGAGLLLVALASLAGTIALDPQRVRGSVQAGLAILGAGVLVVGLTMIGPRVAGDAFHDPDLSRAVTDALAVFMGDLRTFGLWVAGAGVVTIALAAAIAPQGHATNPVALIGGVRPQRSTGEPRRTGTAVVEGLGITLAGLVVITLRDVLVPILLTLAGAYLVYLGLFQVLRGIGAGTLAEARARMASARLQRPVLHRAAAVAAVVAIVAGVMVGGFRLTAAHARARALASTELRCNGATELCDRRIDQVAFAGAHNAMSAAADPGWLFAENLFGIPDQLEYGIRAFLVKTHYGVPTGIRLGGAEIVLTDKAAETAARPRASAEEISPEAAARAQQIAAATRVSDTGKQVYLCHVYCELGATRFSDVLASIKRFLARNPNEVIILFIGDYITTDDTQASFQQAGLLDRLWQYDPDQPLPTLRQLIETRQNILLFEENSGPPPPWNVQGYGLWQDTPYTFADPSDFSCAHNRGPSDAPLFQINHWITNDRPPSVEQARQVNSYDVLMARVRQCQAERNLFPNIVGVNFYDQGDLLRVVDELNGVASNR
ncbi:MAG: hypothetical protein WHS89_05590 [Acidimicrobiales bacterium]